MAANPSKTKVDLRSLMKRQRQGKTSNVKRIESPLAKYNSLGQLTCMVCNIPIKSEIIWNAHIQGKKHKQNIENFKSKSTPVVKTTNQQHPEEDKPTLPTPSKLKRKAEAEEVEIPVPKKLAAKVTSTPSYHVSSAHQSKAEKKQKKREAQLDTTKQEKIAESSTPGMKTSIPEGFFDDPTVDAKVRKVEVKNTAEEEWVKFQKEMEQQQQASQVILEADEAASQVSRNITEIDEQIQRFANVEKLRDKQDEWKAQKLRKQNMSHEDSGGSEDEEDYAEFLDWRSKGAFK